MTRAAHCGISGANVSSRAKGSGNTTHQALAPDSKPQSQELTSCPLPDTMQTSSRTAAEPRQPEDPDHTRLGVRAAPIPPATTAVRQCHWCADVESQHGGPRNTNNATAGPALRCASTGTQWHCVLIMGAHNTHTQHHAFTLSRLPGPPGQQLVRSPQGSRAN